MFDTVHINEKWFFVKFDGARVYLADNKDKPEQLVQHKSHICKVMFLAAVARPRVKNRRTGEWWDGKLCVLPFVVRYMTVWASKNQPAGKYVWKMVSPN